ncbi:MAG: SPOR domain-containing protein, partial [Planctomycetota bacterium]
GFSTRERSLPDGGYPRSGTAAGLQENPTRWEVSGYGVVDGTPAGHRLPSLPEGESSFTEGGSDLHPVTHGPVMDWLNWCYELRRVHLVMLALFILVALWVSYEYGKSRQPSWQERQARLKLQDPPPWYPDMNPVPVSKEPLRNIEKLSQRGGEPFKAVPASVRENLRESRSFVVVCCHTESYPGGEKLMMILDRHDLGAVDIKRVKDSPQGKPMYRVQIGPFDTEEQAKKVRDRLIDIGFEPETKTNLTTAYVRPN